MPEDVNDARRLWREAQERRTHNPIGSAGWREAVYAEIAARERLRDADAQPQPPGKKRSR